MRPTNAVQNVSFPLTVELLVPTGTPQATYLTPILESVRGFDPGNWTGTQVSSVQVGAIRTAPAHLATCVVGGHEFYPGLHYRYSPLVCPGHAEEERMQEESIRHRPIFAAIEHVSSLRPELISDGRGVVLMNIPLGEAQDQTGQTRQAQKNGRSRLLGDARLMQAPCYRGRIIGYGGDDRYCGELGFYPDPGYLLRGECIPVVRAHGYHALHPHEWAARITEHHHDLTSR